jgi:hypothetical protein
MDDKDDFIIIPDKQILFNVFQEWNTNPDYLNSELFLEFLKFKDSWPTKEELSSWKKEMFLEKLCQVNNIEELEDTLDNMDEVNELLKRLEEFEKIIPVNENEIKLELEAINNYDNELLEPYLEKEQNLEEKILNTFNSLFIYVYDWTKDFFEVFF